MRREEVPAEFGSAPEYKGEAAGDRNGRHGRKGSGRGNAKDLNRGGKDRCRRNDGKSKAKTANAQSPEKTQSPEVRKDKGKKTSARRRHKKKSTAQAPKIENKD